MEKKMETQAKGIANGRSELGCGRGDRARNAIGTYLLLPALALHAGRSIITRLAMDNIGTHDGLA